MYIKSEGRTSLGWKRSNFRLWKKTHSQSYFCLFVCLFFHKSYWRFEAQIPTATSRSRQTHPVSVWLYFTWVSCLPGCYGHFPFEIIILFFFPSLLGWVNNTEQTPNCSYSTERTSSSVLGVRDPTAATAEPRTHTGLGGIFLGLCVPCSPGGRYPPPLKDWGSPALKESTKEPLAQTHSWKIWETHVGVEKKTARQGRLCVWHQTPETGLLLEISIVYLFIKYIYRTGEKLQRPLKWHEFLEKWSIALIWAQWIYLINCLVWIQQGFCG